MSTIHGATVYITGAASGIGLATARELARQGADVALFDIAPLDAARDAVAASCCRADQQVVARSLDITDPDAVRAMVDATATEWRAPTIVINSAGVAGGYSFETMSYEQFDRVIRVNLYGTRNVAAAALPWLVRSKGHLVLVASLAGLVGAYGYTSYGASKFGVVGFAQNLRCEIKPKGVRLTVFAPPEIETPLVAEERKSLHPAGVLLKKFAGQVSLDHAVAALVDGIRRDRALVVPGLLAKIVVAESRLLPRSLLNAITDWQVARVLRQMAENK